MPTDKYVGIYRLLFELFVMATEGKAIIFTAVIYAIFYFVSTDEGSEKPWGLKTLNQTWPVGRKWCRFANAPKILGATAPNFGCKNITF